MFREGYGTARCKPARRLVRRPLRQVTALLAGRRTTVALAGPAPPRTAGATVAAAATPRAHATAATSS